MPPLVVGKSMSRERGDAGDIAYENCSIITTRLILLYRQASMMSAEQFYREYGLSRKIGMRYDAR